MRLLNTIFLLTIFSSCKDQNKPATSLTFGTKLLIGEWRLDSSSNRFFSHDRLVVLEDSNLYLFSGSDGGSLLTKGKVIKKDSVATDYYGVLGFALNDSNHFQLSGGWTNTENFYNRIKYGDYHKDLKEYLRQDSLRSKIVGWWKLIPSKMPIRLVNYPGYVNQFTLNIRSDGSATFYLENKLDSTVNYSYTVNPDGIDFNRGCVVGSDCKISFDPKGRMKLVLDRRMNDTVVLERISEIR